MRVRNLVHVFSGIAMLFLFSFFIGSCATAERRAERDVPDWVLQRPAGDNEYEYFVGSGFDEQGSQIRAEDVAVNNLISAIIRFIGVEVTSETSATARATLDTYEADLVQQVQQRGEAVVSGFQIVDSYVAKVGDQVEVYMLGRYERRQLLEEQQRFREMFQERIDAIDVPERRGQEAYAAGRYGAAIPFFLEAGAAAAVSSIQNADIRFDRNMVQARQIIESLVFRPLQESVQGVAYQPLDAAMGVEVFYQRDGELLPVADLPIQVSYREMLDGRRLAVRTAQIRTDNNGLAVFRHPAPSFVGEERVGFSLDLSGNMEPLMRLQGRYRSLVRSTEDAIIRARTHTLLQVESSARHVPTAVLVLDTDMAHNPLRDQHTSNGILSALSAANFNVTSLDIDSRMLQSRSHQEIAAMVADLDVVERLIIGTASISEFIEDDGYIVAVRGGFQVYDVHNGRILYTSNPSSRTRGSSSSGAISSAFRNLGTGLGQEIVRTLP